MNHAAAMLVAHQKLVGHKLETWWDEGKGVSKMYLLEVIKHANGYTDCRKFTDGSDSTKTLTPDHVLLKSPGEPDQWYRLVASKYGVRDKASGWSLGAEAALSLKGFIETPPLSAPARDSTAPGATAAANRPAKTPARRQRATTATKRSTTAKGSNSSAKRIRTDNLRTKQVCKKAASNSNTRQSASRTRGGGKSSK